ncbi:hypothetical protein DSD19_04605 [Rhodovulum sp. BSW8]|uniref:portal protein n=1 Tax=Rhodovulum sp. BSW8 TaxID=2259645 RepID=UPI000DE25481|nr:hypothetical protein [Rhodovulum sp. BSW8]RBO54661.1 hypothetical protein DSD19_04605 [Rhodovulum sp. BSW8]
MFDPETDDNPAYSGQMTYGGPQRSRDPLDRVDTSGALAINVRRNSKLDSEHVEVLWRRLMGHYTRELERQGDNRVEMGVDEDFYDSRQWTEQDAAIVRARGQEPLTYNVIATSIDWMLGTEKRGRTDYKILPRTEDGAKAAEHKTKLLKYLADVNLAEFHVSDAFADMVKVGVGWLECGMQDETDGEPIYERRESWRNILFDSMASERDLSDGRYMFRSKWVDLDEAHALAPERRHIIDLAASDVIDFMRSLDGTGDDQMDAAEIAASQSTMVGADRHHSIRERVRLIEAWFRIPVEDRYVSGGQFGGEIFDPRSPGHQQEVATGAAKVIRKVRMRMHVALMCEAGMLFVARSPYRHNLYPFTPIWCFRSGRDGLPYGYVRRMRDPQSDVNKRASKALFILSTNKVVMDKGAVDDMREFRDEVARPDAIIVKKQGYEIDLNVDRELSAAHLDLMSRSLMMIQQMGGVTDENLGRETNASSGRAIARRQDQGALATASAFDNLRFARQVHGSKMLSLTEQYMTQRKQFRITDMRGNASFITVNDPLLPASDIVRTKADFIISEDDWNATIRQGQVDELLAVMGKLAPVSPQIVLAMLDLVVETMDIPQREELVKRIRQVTGMEDPDADPNDPDPEAKARRAAKEAESQFQQAMAMAELAEKQASAAEKQAKAQKAGVETAKLVAEVRQILANTAGTNVETQVRALEAAAVIMKGANLAGAADTVLREANYAPGSGPLPGQPGQGAQMPTGPLPPQQPQPQQMVPA